MHPRATVNYLVRLSFTTEKESLLPTSLILSKWLKGEEGYLLSHRVKGLPPTPQGEDCVSVIAGLRGLI